MQAGPASLRAWGEPGVTGQAGERGLDGVVDQPGARWGDEEARRPRLGAQRVEGGGMQRHLAALSELRVPDGEHALVEVDVIPVEADPLANAHPRHAEK